ncbi:hypothetical protein TUBRATIS_003150 [Tubulinosema ratisbonensis]|uniref:Uncharacterized protein n=1 Tax=Tubulinosema ratisbonensis TaxID=291195 RepID=A0A437API7_9MICR|nr:hypothetical protein TUBRATIS_003150 [Tubulinosema ratisbonensis]
MLDNQIIQELAKKIESTNGIPKNSRLYLALESKETIKIRFYRHKIIVEHKLSSRQSLDDLIDKNIYKTENDRNKFRETQKKLNSSLKINKKVKAPYLSITISSQLAGVAKELDFHLKKQKIQRLKRK